MRTEAQIALPVETEKFTEREKKIKALLRKYPILDRRIAHFEMLARGDGLLHQPSVTAAPPSEDDPWVLVEIAMHAYSDREQDIIRLVSSLLSPQGFTYATKERVAAQLTRLNVDDESDDELRKMIVEMLLETSGEERVELTDTERVAILREREIRMARQRLLTLRDEKKWATHALNTLKEVYEPDYQILWQRYVLDKPVPEVCEYFGLEHPRDNEIYKKRRKKAMVEIAKWLPGYMIGG